MKFSKLVEKFNELGYDLEYGMGYEGRGYYLRQFGSMNNVGFRATREGIEEELYHLQERERLERLERELDLEIEREWENLISEILIELERYKEWYLKHRERIR